MDLHHFVDAALIYSTLCRASVTSWGRTPKRNDQVGGVAKSYHTLWLAVDVIYDDPIPLPVRRARAQQLGLQLIAESNHDHLEPAPENPRNAPRAA